MSGSIASRYIGGVPYGPGTSVGRYPNAASLQTTPGVVNFPAVNPAAYPTSGGGVVAPTVASATGGGAAVEGGDNMLASLLLGALSIAPDAYNYLDKLLSDEPAQQSAAVAGPTEIRTDLGPLDSGSFVGPGGVAIPNAALGGFGMNPDNYFQPGTWAVDDLATQRLLDAPIGELGQAPGDGSAFAMQPASGAGPALTAAQAADPLYGSLGENPIVGGDLATGLAGMGGGTLGGIIAAQAPWTRQGYGAIGSQVGSAAGGIAAGALMGSALGPIGTAFGALGGALLGGWAGGAGGSQIGPAPTIGGNFSTIGTFDGSGGLNWGNAGGDNGADANDATGFANWFAPSLMQQAAQQGLGFNPNMAGAQIRVGGYDNPSRSGYAQGGYFYDLTNAGGSFGGSPERYALRSSDMFNNDAYSPGQANAFTTNVLADLTARGVFTPGGQAGPDQGYLGSTLGANYGWYGAPGDLYSQIEYGGAGGFNDILQGRRNAVTGYVNQQNLQQQTNAAAQQVLGAAYNPFNSYDPGYGWQGMAANLPADGAPAGVPDIYQGMSQGLQGVQMTENGPIWTGTAGAPVGVPAGGGGFAPQADGGA